MRKVKYGIIILLNYIYVPLKCIFVRISFSCNVAATDNTGNEN